MLCSQPCTSLIPPQTSQARLQLGELGPLQRYIWFRYSPRKYIGKVLCISVRNFEGFHNQRNIWLWNHLNLFYQQWDGRLSVTSLWTTMSVCLSVGILGKCRLLLLLLKNPSPPFPSPHLMELQNRNPVYKCTGSR